MKRPRLLDALLAPVLAAAPLSHAAGTRFAGPHGDKAAASLARDDALDSQLDNAITALDRAGLEGRFHLTLANPPLRSRLDE